MPVHKRIAGGKILRHTNGGIINGRITVGVIFTQNVPDDTGRFLIRFIRKHTRFIHGVQNTAVDRFQPVSDVR